MFKSLSDFAQCESSQGSDGEVFLGEAERDSEPVQGFSWISIQKRADNKRLNKITALIRQNRKMNIDSE